MGGMYSIGGRPSLLQGTINGGGTLSSEIDIDDFTIAGLITDANFALGTLSFQVSHVSDSNGTITPLYVDVIDNAGATVTIGPVSGAKAIDAQYLMQVLAPYRFIKIKSSVTQTNGVKFWLPARG